ncbi:hypothetical protein IX339_001324 [Porphyromonas levii]|nr:hypothetical protein [Porphyromonas levii]
MSNGEMQNVHIKGIVTTKLNGIGGGLRNSLCEFVRIQIKKSGL